ncbi:MAG TPA: alpha/beta fold hydrolase [Streptosporangiaceae bacterium]|nr:alpha/beta fold hydrolase [Streptosporangiaceae bacterium]
MTAPPNRPGPSRLEAARYARQAHVRLDGCGPPGSARRRPVLLLHGLGGDCAQPWAFLAGDHGLRRIAPDLRAHGATGYIGPDDAFSFDGLADDVVALLDRLGVTGPVIAAGVSMGAGIALNLALRYPDRVTALALVRPAWLDQPLPPNLTLYPLMAALLRQHGPEPGLARFEATDAYRAVRAVSDSGAASLRGQFTAPFAVERAVRLDRMPRSSPSPDVGALRRVSQPALVVGAPRDPVHPLALAEATAAALPTATLRVVAARDEDPPGQLAQIAGAVARFVAEGASG